MHFLVSTLVRFVSQLSCETTAKDGGMRHHSHAVVIRWAPCLFLDSDKGIFRHPHRLPYKCLFSASETEQLCAYTLQEGVSDERTTGT